MRISDWSSDVCSSDLVITGKISPSFNKGWGKAEIEAEQRGRGFGLSENQFGDFAAGPDLSRRWDDVRRSIAFAAERLGYSLVPSALCTRPVDKHGWTACRDRSCPDGQSAVVCSIINKTKQ